jgi:DNA invertase Pin-like site-specific DNA recombinase
MSKKTPVAILVRVSTKQQETDRQISELHKYAEEQNYDVVSVVEEAVSGSSSRDDRSGLHQIESMARTKVIQKVLVHEVS